jgi:hypothetical protein
MQVRIGTALIAASMSAELLAAPAMTAGEFVARAEPLMARGQIVLIFSPEAHRLMGIVRNSARNLRAQQDADRAARRPARTCLPPKGKAEIGATELLGYMRALTPAQKSQSFDAAFRTFAAQKYPCPA